MEEDEDDFYAPEENQQNIKVEVKPENVEAMDEDEDEEAEESDSDIEIVTEQKEIDRPEPSKSVRTPLTITRPEATSTGRASPAIKTATSATPPPSKPGSSYPALKTSTLDLDAKPIHESSGKPITQVDIDNDIEADDKPWRIPGSDQTDYFNYGFDEFTWAAYCMKQSTLRAENKEQKKAMGEFQNMFNGAPTGGVIGGNNANAAAAGMMPGFPGDIPPDMQAAMQAMMASGMDPSQMDMNSFMQMMGGAGAQGFGGQGMQNMGGYDAYGMQQQQQQQQQHQQQQGHGGARGNRRGRGRW